MGRIECGDGEDGEPVGAHRAGPDGRRRAGMPAGAWTIDWGGREAGTASRIFIAASFRGHVNMAARRLLSIVRSHIIECRPTSQGEEVAWYSDFVASIPWKNLSCPST